MEAFLRKRGVKEETLKKLKDQKIDEDAANGMTDSDLEEYIPKKGDRFALKDFLTQLQKKPKSKKASLMDRLKHRLNCKNLTESSEEQEEHAPKKIQKLSAKKDVHKVHLGWYHFDELKKMFLHVRAEAGGGKRTMMLHKSMNKESIIKECLDLFYPKGKSQHGDLKNMNVELTDFQLKPLENENTTLADIIDTAKLQFIHFYLRTRRISENKADSVDESDKHDGDTKSIKSMNRQSVIQVDMENDDSSAPGTSGTSSAPGTSGTSSVPGTSGINGAILIANVHTSENEDDTSSLPDPFQPVWEDTFEEVAFTHTAPIANTTRTTREPKDIKIVVHRGQVLRELITIFKERTDIDFERDTITATLILPNGEKEQAYDDGGVMRDLLTEFWNDFYEQCTTGTSLKVPCLRHDMEASDWKAVGRIIAFGVDFAKGSTNSTCSQFFEICSAWYSK